MVCAGPASGAPAAARPRLSLAGTATNAAAGALCQLAGQKEEEVEQERPGPDQVRAAASASSGAYTGMACQRVHGAMWPVAVRVAMWLVAVRVAMWPVAKLTL